MSWIFNFRFLLTLGRIKLKGALDNYNIIPNIFWKSWDFYIIRSAGMAKDCIAEFYILYLTYFWRNMNISCIFSFSKSTSINTQYRSLWDTLKMMLFTKYLIKWKRIGRISCKFWYWFNLKPSIELYIKR